MTGHGTGLPEPAHHCHAIGCNRRCPPAMFMCRLHWRVVPRDLKRAVWAAYVPGQEIRKDPSRDYLQVSAQARIAVAEFEGKADQIPPGLRLVAAGDWADLIPDAFRDEALPEV